MQPGTALFPDFDTTVDAMLADWQPDADKAIAEMEPEPSLEEWLSTAGTATTISHRD